MNRKFFLLLILFYSINLYSGTPGKTTDYVREHEQVILKDYVELLSIPNEASDTQNIRRNADWIMNAMQKRGLSPQLLQAKDPAAPPAIFGRLEVSGAKQTLMFYAHYDGQPADPELWKVTKPWEPVFRAPGSAKNLTFSELQFPLDPQFRIYGRSTSDDKAGVMAILTALDAVRSGKQTITSNLKFFFEGEEEAGSPNLSEVTSQYRDLLQADAWILVDGPVHPSGRKQVAFGVRGDANVDITVYGPVRPLHSGHYGNWAPNPAMMLAQLLASMKDENGHVLVDGWYSDVTPLSALELEMIAKAPMPDEELRNELGLARSENPPKSLLQLILEPSLNINGMRSADVGPRARNVIPIIAEATLDLRLVKGNDFQRQFEKLTRHIQKQGFTVLDREPTVEERRSTPKIARVILAPGGYNAQRTSMDLPISKFVTKAVQSSSEQEIVVVPSFGGSLPLSIIEKNTGAPTISVPLANHDNNQHAEDENLRIANFWNGIETIAALYTTAP